MEARRYRTGGREWPWCQPREHSVQHDGWLGLVPNQSFEHVYASDPRGYFGPGNTVSYQLNQAGFRGPLPPVGEPGRHQVVLLGDSFTFGEGVRFDDTFAALLPGQLQPRVLDGAPVDVVNLSQPGMDTQQEGAILRKFGHLTTPDLLVLFVVPNDWPSRAVRGAHAGDVRGAFVAMFQEPTGLARYSHLGRWLGHRFRGTVLTRQFDAALDRIAAELPADRQARDQAARWIADIRAQVEQRGARFAAAVLPEMVRLDRNYPYAALHAAVRDIGKEQGFAVVDLLPAFAGTDPTGWWVHPTDHHPNELAHREIARVLGAELQADFLGPATVAARQEQ